MIKLSIIVPIYNVEQYLRKCVDSLLNQDIPSSEYEIILVDDGGHDKCPQICDDYAEAHTNVRVVHRENGGLSEARNSGIKVAHGEYLMFVDSDDYWEENVLSGLMDQVDREQLDVLRYDYQNVRLKNEREYEVFEPNKYPRKADSCAEVVDGMRYLNERMGYSCYVTQFIIKRNLIVDGVQCKVYGGNCLFTEGIHFEDVDWMPRMMLKAKRVNSTQTVVYNYLHREGSITKTQGNKDKIRKNIEDEVSIIEKYRNHIDMHPNCKWLRNMQSSMAIGVLISIACNFYPEHRDYIQRLKKTDAFPLAIADQGKTFVRRARLCNLLGPNMFCILMHYLR